MTRFMYIDFNTFKDDLKKLEIFKNIDDDTFVAEHSGKIGKISFYDPYIEMEITKDKETIFYLQSELISRGQIDDYIKAFFQKLFLNSNEKNDGKEITINDEFKILFVCTCGVTSSDIAKHCRDIATSLNSNAKFSAVSLDRLIEVEKEYDTIFYLPQIAYLVKKNNYEFMDKVIPLDIKDVGSRDFESIYRFTLIHTANIKSK